MTCANAIAGERPRRCHRPWAWHSVGVKQIPRVATAAAIGIAIGLLSSLVFTMLVIAVALLVALVTRVAAQETDRNTGPIPQLALAVGIGTLAGRLIGWFGIIGGVAALVLLVVVFFAAGGDLV